MNDFQLYIIRERQCTVEPVKKSYYPLNLRVE